MRSFPKRPHDRPPAFKRAVKAALRGGGGIAKHRDAISGDVPIRLGFPPTHDSVFLLKVHSNVGEPTPASQINAEAAALEHARSRLEAGIPGARLVPEVYLKDDKMGVIALERIRGNSLEDANMPSWTPKQRIRFVRQLAVLRILLLTPYARWIGIPSVGGEGEETVGPMSGHLYYTQGREEYYRKGLYDPGPYRSVKDWVLGCIQKELVYYRHELEDKTQPDESPSSSHEGREKWVEYLEDLHDFCKTRDFREDEPIVLSHDDIPRKLRVRGSKIAALVDWETASYLPYSESISDLISVTEPCDLNPRTWIESAQKPFSRQPSLKAENFAGRLSRYRAAGGQNANYPDCDLIDEYGGPLCSDDFAEYPSDGEDDCDGHVDGVNKYGESDDEADDLPDAEPDLRRHWRTTDYEWFSRPVWKLVHEFVTRGGEEEIKFGGQIRDSLAYWRDPVVVVTTTEFMDPGTSQVFLMEN